MLVQCAECKWKYPDNLLNNMFIHNGYTQPICGQCALEISNLFHTAERKKFGGEIAEHMRQLALRWRKKNKRHAPNEADQKAAGQYKKAISGDSDTSASNNGGVSKT